METSKHNNNNNETVYTIKFDSSSGQIIQFNGHVYFTNPKTIKTRAREIAIN